MIKKIILSSLAASSLLLANETAVDQVKLEADIAKVQKEKDAVDAKLSALEAQRAQNQAIMTNVKLGYVKTDGNTDTETFSLDGKVKKDFGNNSLALTANMQYGEAETVKTKENYFTELQYAYLFTDAISFSYVVGYKNDKFSSYNYQTYTGPGVVYHTFKTASQFLDLEASILYSKDELQIPDSDFTDVYSAYKAKATYELQILENLKFNQELSYRASFEESENYFVFSNSELSSKISDIFSAGLGYKIDYTNLVTTGIEKKDTTLTAFLSADF